LRTRAVEALAPRDRGQTEPQVPQGLPENSPPVHWRVRKEGKIRVPQARLKNRAAPISLPLWIAIEDKSST